MGIKLRPKVHTTAAFSRTVFFCLASLAACRPSATPGPRVHFPFLAAPEWRGQAEVAEYVGQLTRYREPRRATLTLITVTEPLLPGPLVKAEQPRAESVPALKQNQVLSYQTGTYPYRQMNSIFWRADYGELLRATMTSQEWCGQTLKDIRREGDHLRLSWNSYWEGEALGNAVVGIPHHTAPVLAVLYDELPLLVRTPEFRHYRGLYLYPLLMSSQVYRPDWDIGGPKRQPAFVSAVAEPDTERILVDGREVLALRVTVRWSEGGSTRVDTFWVDDASPHRTLLRWRRYDGSEFSLAKQSFAAYWKLNHVGDVLP